MRGKDEGARQEGGRGGKGESVGRTTETEKWVTSSLTAGHSRPTVRA